MGCRGQVYSVDDNIYLYTHWGADKLLETVRKALSRGQRWNDSEYLNRIIFETMILEEKALGSETGFGIGGNEHGDIEILIRIHCANQTIEIIEGLNLIYKASFALFCAENYKEGYI